MDKKKIKKSIISGITIFPSLIAFGIFLSMITSQKISWLFWINIPAWIFEELFEIKFLKLSDSIILNSIFAFIFWLTVSILSKYIKERVFKKENGKISKNN